MLVHLKTSMSGFFPLGFQAVQEDTGSVEIGILKVYIILDQTNISFLNSQATMGFFAFLV